MPRKSPKQPPRSEAEQAGDAQYTNMNRDSFFSREDMQMFGEVICGDHCAMSFDDIDDGDEELDG